MSDLLEETAANGTGTSDRVLARARWSRPRKAVFLGGLAAAALGAAAWALLPGLVTISQTQVLLDAKPFKCANAADVTTYAETEFAGDDAQVFVPAIRLHPTLDCTMDVLVRNASDSDIAVDSISIPMAGPSNGWGVHADRGYQQGMTPTGGRNALDATFDYQHDPRSGGSYGLAADSVTRFTFHLSWSDGCMDDGSAAVFNDAPTAVISAGPWHIAKSWSGGAGYAVLGGKNTFAASCDH